MPVFGESSTSFSSSSSSSTIAEHIKLRRPRNEMSQVVDPTNAPPQPPQIPSARSKSTISSLFNSANTTPKKKLNNTFRGFGCTAAASQQVSLPAVIRTSADWDGKKVKKKKQKNNDNRKKNTSNNDVIKISSLNSNKSSAVAAADGTNSNSNNPASCMLVQDVWCGPGIGFSADAVVGSVDCVVTRRNVSGRGKIDIEKVNQREREREREREVISNLQCFCFIWFSAYYFCILCIWQSFVSAW